MLIGMPEPEDIAADRAAEKAPRPPVSPVAWVILGIAVTLTVVLALRLTEPGEVPPVVDSPKPAASRDPEAASAARADFAGLYLHYLLKTYYVYERGFCNALLVAICQALLTTELLNSPSTCQRLPNDELVLAIGRFQHKTGLPVDGKAGPETVRMMLGGTFASRRGMAEKYCPGWRSGPAPSASPSVAVPATIDW